MNFKPPNGFEELKPASEKPIWSAISVVGVVVDFLPATKSRGTDFMLTFTLKDSSWSPGVGLKCRVFAKNEERMPSISSNGDVVALHSFVLRESSGEAVAVSRNNSSWLVFHQQDIPADIKEIQGDLPVFKMSDQVPSPGKDLIEYAIRLCNSLDRSKFGESDPGTLMHLNNLLGSTSSQLVPRGQKFQLIQDLVVSKNSGDLKFADLLGEVRKKYSYDSRVELSITDYTSHESLYDYSYVSELGQGRDGDQFGYAPSNTAWPGPWGKLSMVVCLWDAHASFAEKEVHLGDLVLLRNVHIGFDREGDKLEGKLRGDRLQPKRIGVSICEARQAKDDDRVKALLKRRRNYEDDLKLNGIKGVVESMKPKGGKMQPPQMGKLSKTQRKKQKNAKKTEEKKQKAEAERKAKQTANSQTLNPNIRTNKVPPTVSSVTIAQIMDPTTLLTDHTTPNGNPPISLPFKNNQYHVRNIRVIDFHPHNIAHFAAPHQPSDYDHLSSDDESHGSFSSSSSSSSDIDMLRLGNTADLAWEWRFELLVEDAHATSTTTSTKPDGGRAASRMKMLVAGQDAEFLLRNVQATDLERDGEMLERLKERLFLLWGNLAERVEEQEEERRRKEGAEMAEKREPPSARPFECLVREYGVKGKRKGEWERVFAMFGTTIVDGPCTG